MPRKDATTGPISAQAQQDLVSEGIENFELPKSLVTKIAKSSIPENCKLQKDTVLSLVKGSTVFINYLAATAHDVAQSKQHKSISASDVLKALEMIEFGDLVDNLQTELQVYRDNTKGGGGKKSISANAGSKGKGKETESNPAASRSKGKERAAPLPPPFTSVPRVSALSSISQTDANGAEEDGMDEEEEEDLADPGPDDDDEVVEEDEIVEEEEDDVEGEEVIDLMNIEDDEFGGDSMAIDAPEEEVEDE